LRRLRRAAGVLTACKTIHGLTALLAAGLVLVHAILMTLIGAD
ncbi:hypothetical protein LCGC14_2545350, partial [marine sediment metagenome]